MLQINPDIGHLKRFDLKIHVAKPFIKIILNCILNVSVFLNMIEPISINNRSFELAFIYLKL